MRIKISLQQYMVVTLAVPFEYLNEISSFDGNHIAPAQLCLDFSSHALDHIKIQRWLSSIYALICVNFECAINVCTAALTQDHFVRAYRIKIWDS